MKSILAQLQLAHLLFLAVIFSGSLQAQDLKKEKLEESKFNSRSQDSVLEASHETSETLLLKADSVRKTDSLETLNLAKQIEALRGNERSKKEILQKRLDSINQANDEKNELIKKQVDSLRASTPGIPVVIKKDTLLFIYTKLGPFSASVRAKTIEEKILKIAHGEFSPDQIKVFNGDESSDLFYNDIIILSVTDKDAFWLNKKRTDAIEEYKMIVITAVEKYIEDTSLMTTLLRIGMVLLVIGILFIMVKYLNKGFSRLVGIAGRKGKKHLKSIKIKNYEVLTFDRQIRAILFVLNIFKWLAIIFIIYSALPVIFSIFPATESIARTLIGYVINPVRSMIAAILAYIPSLITIAIIATVAHYFVRFLRYLSKEIEEGKLVIPGFYTDWAKPTFGLISFLVHAFAFIVIFPYLPGSDSPVFQGVSVFLGLLISLGSSSAIGNMIAGLVITYMRPFKIGERVKIGDTIGDVIEKNMLVTRIRTIKNEDITIPNAAILNGQTTNYSSSASNLGLILNSTVTIGYDVHWKKISDSLIRAAEMTPNILKEPKPFVLQTSLDDFYVSYQINGYTREPKLAVKTYSELHANIQDVFQEEGIEIMSPHFRAERDGSAIQIPKSENK